METLGSILLITSFIGVVVGLGSFTVVFHRLLWENRDDRPNPETFTRLLQTGNRSIQWTQVAILSMCLSVWIAMPTLEYLLYAAVVGYGISWLIWMPLKLFLFMASGGVTRMTAKLFPQSPV